MNPRLPSAPAVSAEAYAGDLQQIVHELLFKTHVPSAPLQNLARRIQLDVMSLADTNEVFDPGATLDDTLLYIDWQSEPAVYAKGIRTARLLAYAAPRMFGWSDRTELLVIAALLQDVGLLLLERQYDMPSGQLLIAEPTAYRQHPSLSAAVAGAITEYAIDLPAVIAQHHERSDGTGYPTAVRSDQLSAPARLLAIASRYIELVDDPVAKDSSAGNAQIAPADAAQQLWREALQGELDALLTAGLLQQVGLEVPAEERSAVGRYFQLNRFGQTLFRRDSAVPEAEASTAKGQSADDVVLPPGNVVNAPHVSQQLSQQRGLRVTTEERGTAVRR